MRDSLVAESLTASIAGPVNNLSGSRAGVMAIVDDDSAVDQDIIDAFGILLGVVVGRSIGNSIGIENDDVAPIAFAQLPAIFKP